MGLPLLPFFFLTAIIASYPGVENVKELIIPGERATAIALACLIRAEGSFRSEGLHW